MMRTSLLQRPGRHCTLHWSGLHEQLSPWLSASTERAPRISLPNFGKYSCTNTVECLISHQFSKEYDNVNECPFPPKLQTMTSWTRSGPRSYHIKGSNKCVWCWVCSVLSKQRRGDEMRWWGEVHISQLQTRTPVVLYRLWSYTNWDVLAMYYRMRLLMPV